ncbi:MAG TPA: LysM domain-containing protein [Aggregatilineales bacterium]|nr:LysM domain-containing protein [Aggregatilineales bacterium]
MFGHTLSRFRRVVPCMAVVIAVMGCSLFSAPATPTPLPTIPPIIVITATPNRLPTITPINPQPNFPTPTSPSACIPQTSWPLYQVQTGDTLASIAARVGTTVDVLVSANCLANANFIVAGQFLRVPTLPVVVTNTPPVANNPTIGQVLITPATPSGGGYIITFGTVTVSVTGVSNASVVTFYLLQAGQFSAVQIGRDTFLQDGASITWAVTDASLNGQVWAVATGFQNQNVQTVPVAVTVQAQAQAPSVSSLFMSPSTTDPTRPNTILLPAGGIVVSATAFNATRVEFYYAATGGFTSAPVLIGQVNNPLGQASITWNTTGLSGTGLVWAVARNNAGQSGTTASIPILFLGR